MQCKDAPSIQCIQTFLSCLCKSFGLFLNGAQGQVLEQEQPPTLNLPHSQASEIWDTNKASFHSVKQVNFTTII